VEGPLSIALALLRERQLKRWSRAKKLAPILNQTELLKKLSHSTRPALSNMSGQLPKNRFLLDGSLLLLFEKEAGQMVPSHREPIAGSNNQMDHKQS
jgi:hypothetical protein